MRVVSGTARGVSLLSLEGLETRPTTDRVKESMFNVLQFELYGKRVLDLFAGSGALGIEALSRGAASATFVDQNPKALDIVGQNLKKTRLDGQARLVRDSFESFLKRAAEPFDIVFLDPPYASDFAPRAVSMLLEQGLLSPRSVVVLEHDREQTETDTLLSDFVKKTYRYGKTFVTFYRNEG